MTSTPTTTPAVDNEDGATRVGPMHEAFAAFLNAEFQAGITAQQIFLVTSKRKAFRSTDAYRVGVKGAQAEAKAAELAAKEERAAARVADRQRKAEEKAAAVAAKKAEEAAAKADEAPVEKAAPAAKAPAKPAAKKATATKATPTKTA